MQLTSLAIRHVRRIDNAVISPSKSINLVSGANGSGKTSLLESIHFLATARSFRTSSPKNVITHGRDSLVVSGELVDASGVINRVGIEKTTTLTRLRLNGEALIVASTLARIVPILNFNSESFSLLDGGPSNRRSLLDRLLFHVEQQYLDTLKKFYRVLKQRNMLLRNRAAKNQFAGWDQQMAGEVRKLDIFREKCVSTINRYLQAMPISPFIGHLQLEYYRGWHRDIEFEKFLTDNWLRDSDAGTTTAGPHRAELRFKVNEKLAKTTVSRGQGKLIIAAIVGAQARYLCDHGAERPILLVDDLASELDRNARKMAVDSLMDTKSQIFFTAIEATDLPNDLTDIAKMFHVEQGKILPLDSVGV